MLWILVIGLAAILIFSWWKPKMFKTWWESIVGSLWIFGVGAVDFLREVTLYLQTDTTWRELVNEKYAALAVMLVGLLYIALRYVNTNKKR